MHGIMIPCIETYEKEERHDFMHGITWTPHELGSWLTLFFRLFEIKQPKTVILSSQRSFCEDYLGSKILTENIRQTKINSSMT